MIFLYKALKDNKTINGRLEAGTEIEVIAHLKSIGLFPIDIKEAGAANPALSFFSKKVSFNDIVDFTRQIAIMLNAGLTLIDSFDILKKQVSKPALRKTIYDLDKEIRGGKTFSSALERQRKYFSNLYISLVKSGEASGKLSEILLKLSENLEKQREFQGKIKGALVYPVIVIVGMIGVAFIMITFVVPKLLGLYKDFNIDLPLPTKILISLSNFSTNYWPFIIGGVFAAMYFLKKYLKTKKGKYKKDALMLKAPVISNIVQMSVLVDSTRTLSILIGSGVSILEALSIVIETSDNSIYQQAFTNIYSQVEKGMSIGQAMVNEKIFPPILIQMTTVGEQTGHLDETLFRISRYFEMESEMAVKTMTTLIEPMILVVLGIGVGFLVIAVISPIYNLTSSFS